MKIRNNKNFNVSLMAQHGGKGTGAPARIVLVAGSLTEFSDAAWVPFALAAKDGLKSGAFTMVKSPALTLEEHEAAKADELAQAMAIVEAANKRTEVSNKEASEAAELQDSIDANADKRASKVADKETAEAEKNSDSIRAAAVKASNTVNDGKLVTPEPELTLEGAEALAGPSKETLKREATNKKAAATRAKTAAAKKAAAKKGA